MTSEEKLARIMAQRAVRETLQKLEGTVDFYEMLHMFNVQPSVDLSGGEFEVFERVKAALKAKDDKRLEAEMEVVDAFKATLIEQFDKLIKEKVVELRG